MKNLLGLSLLLVGMQAPVHAEVAASSDFGMFSGLQGTTREDLYPGDAPISEFAVLGLSRARVNGQLVPHHYTVYHRFPYPFLGSYSYYDRAEERGVNTKPSAVDPAQQVVDQLRTQIWGYLYGANSVLAESQKQLKVLGTTPDHPPPIPANFRPDDLGGLVIPRTLSDRSGGIRCADAAYPEGLYLWFELLPALPEGGPRYEAWKGAWVVIEIPEATRELLTKRGVELDRAFSSARTIQGQVDVEEETLEGGSSPDTEAGGVAGPGVLQALTAALSDFANAVPAVATAEQAASYSNKVVEILRGTRGTDFAIEWEGDEPTVLAIQTAIERGWVPELVGNSSGWVHRAAIRSRNIPYGVRVVVEGELPGKFPPGLYVYSVKSGKGYIFSLPPGDWTAEAWPGR